METSYLKAHLGTVTLSGRPISIQTVISIRTFALGDPKAPRMQEVPPYQGEDEITLIT